MSLIVSGIHATIWGGGATIWGGGGVVSGIHTYYLGGGGVGDCLGRGVKVKTVCQGNIGVCQGNMHL